MRQLHPVRIGSAYETACAEVRIGSAFVGTGLLTVHTAGTMIAPCKSSLASRVDCVAVRASVEVAVRRMTNDDEEGR